MSVSARERGMRGAQALIDSGDLVPTGPIQEAFERRGLSAAEVARRLGWTRPDGQRVRRTMGLAHRPGQTQKGAGAYMKRAQAELLAEALHLDPMEAGL